MGHKHLLLLTPPRSLVTVPMSSSPVAPADGHLGHKCCSKADSIQAKGKGLNQAGILGFPDNLWFPLFCSLSIPAVSKTFRSSPLPQPGARAPSRSRAGRKLQVSFPLWLHGLPRHTSHTAPQPALLALLPQKVGKVKKCGSQSRAFCEWSCRSAWASQRQGPAALTGGPRPLPLPL